MLTTVSRVCKLDVEVVVKGGVIDMMLGSERGFYKMILLE